jgi:hypothetical protein
MADAQSKLNSTGRSPNDTNGCMIEYTPQNIEVRITIRILKAYCYLCKDSTANMVTLLC